MGPGCALAAFLRGIVQGTNVERIKRYDKANGIYTIFPRAVIIVRSDIQNNLNCDILAKISDVLKCSEQKDERKSNAQGVGEPAWTGFEPMELCLSRQRVCMHRMVKDSQYTIFCCAMHGSLCGFLEMKNFERARDLLDRYHCLPNMIADNHFSVPNAYWRPISNPIAENGIKRFCARRRISGERTCASGGCLSKCLPEPHEPAEGAPVKDGRNLRLSES